MTGRAAALVAAALALTACRRTRTPPPPPTTQGLIDCTAALTRAPAAPPQERTGLIVRGCAVCGTSFEPLIPAANGHPDLAAVHEVLTACQLGCSKRAMGRFRGLLGDVTPGPGVTRPWKALAEDCPTAMRTGPTTERFAGPVWLALVTIGARIAGAEAALPPSAWTALSQARAGVVIPLPPWTVVGNGLVVPPGAAAPGMPWRHVTVTDQALLVGRLPIARLGADGLVVDAPGAPYPGTPTTGDLSPALAALGPAPTGPDRLDDVVVIAPTAAPAARALAAVRALGATPARFAVAVPDEVSLWRGSIAAHRLRLAPIAGARIRLDLAAARIAVVTGAGAVVASAPWPDGATLRARVQAAVAFAGAAAIELVETAPDDLEVAGLVELCDDLAAAGAPSLALAPDGATATGAELPQFDPAALAAALAKAAQP
ncbi:MAG: hypothetical protein IPL61_02745 [Myxococcales bacterium]|nr:hypothetical protein [Myxococcales bacterium]